MNWFKRLCLFVFGLSGILSLAALSLVWVGPWTLTARTLITENKYYYYILVILVCIAAFGLLCCVLASLFSPRSPRESIVAEVDGGNITVTRTAVVSQTRHIIEADGTCTPTSVRVRMRKRGKIKIYARVKPHLPLDVVERGEILYAELAQGLAKVCGNSVQSIDLVFLEPEERGTLDMYVDTESIPEVQVAENAVSYGYTSASPTLRVEGKDVNMNPQAEAAYPAMPGEIDLGEPDTAGFEEAGFVPDATDTSWEVANAADTTSYSAGQTNAPEEV